MPSKKNNPKFQCEIVEYSGGFTVKVPRYMVNNMNTPGDKTALCRHYTNRLIGFRERFNRELCIELLSPYGAWNDADFARMTGRTIQDTLLWVILGNEEVASDSATVTSYIGD
jgi:hypothetical protein